MVCSAQNLGIDKSSVAALYPKGFSRSQYCFSINVRSSKSRGCFHSTVIVREQSRVFVAGQAKQVDIGHISQQQLRVPKDRQ